MQPFLTAFYKSFVPTAILLPLFIPDLVLVRSLYAKATIPSEH